MDVNGRGWGWMRAMGCRNAGGRKNKVNRDINVDAGHNFVPLWSGKFPPTSCFAKQPKKHARITPHGCVWVSMAAVGLFYTEGSKNKTKRGTNR